MCTDDTYNIPRVTDCTRELNEWVYSDVRGRDKLFSAQPRELPELVRRFTQDIYMCVYVQPDIAMYGDADEEEYPGRCLVLNLPRPFLWTNAASILMEGLDNELWFAYFYTYTSTLPFVFRYT